MQNDNILSFLYTHKDTYTSGQAMADGLGVTRAAVWKSIEALRASGYVIESAAAKGYKLISIPDLLTEREITLGLNTRVFGRRVIALDEVDSTNTFASRLAADGEPEGTLVVSESQTAGRGRLGRKWVSPHGVNILMSLILRPQIPPMDAPMTTLLAASALARAIKGLYGLPAAIKWPNDLLINGRKAAGILTEMSAEPDRVRHIILGVGIDVNMKRESFPREIRESSTSIMAELGHKAVRAELLRRFMEELEQSYGLFTSGDRKGILDEWRSHSCTLGKRVRVNTPRGEKAGVAVDIDDNGGLIIDTDGGSRETVTSGDVSFL